MSEVTKVPVKAKRPQDKKPKAEKPVIVDGRRIVTVNGHEYSVPEDGVPDDFEFLDDLGEVESGNASRLPAVLKRILGKEGFREAMNNIRGEDGVVSIEDGAALIRDLFEALNPNS